ncbi:RadC family protein [Desertibaculum subflavum]|uniref:RadC family protein n=1 Tax=Desertibaculum subflavum TaxID=2268458 RepID=UPI000E66EAAA
MNDAAPPEKPHHTGHRARLRARFLEAPSAVPDYEILEMMLFAANPRGDMKTEAKRLLGLFGNSFARLLNADRAALRAAGLTEAQIGPIVLAREAATRLTRADLAEKPILSNWQALLDYVQVAQGEAPVEQFRVLFLDRKNALLKDELQQQGTIDQTPVFPREVVKRALELGASALILVHNHPSGDVKPSRADIEMTKQVRDAAKALGINLHDHVIVGRGRHASLKSMGLI